MDNDFEKILKEMNNENLYSILKSHKEADPLELKSAFKKMMKLHHPDKVPESMKEEASKKFQKIRKVYDFLKNQLNRDQYNKHLGHLEERKIRVSKMNSERKKFQDDLVKREKEGKEFKGESTQHENGNQHKKHTNEKASEASIQEESIRSHNDFLFKSISCL